MGFWFILHQLFGQYRKSVLLLYNQRFISSVISNNGRKSWWKRNVRLFEKWILMATYCKLNLFYCERVSWIRQKKAFREALEIITAIPSRWCTANCLNRHSDTALKDIERQPICIGNDALQFKSNAVVLTSKTIALHILSCLWITGWSGMEYPNLCWRVLKLSLSVSFSVCISHFRQGTPNNHVVPPVDERASWMLQQDHSCTTTTLCC